MAKFKIEHDRPNCIGCGACAAVAPDFWIMNDKDGKSDLIGSVHVKEGREVIREDLDIDELKGNKEAAESCPVNVIHIFDKEKKHKII
jgi:ferredoxin